MFVAFVLFMRHIRDMPAMPDQPSLLRRVNALVRSCEYSQSEAARRLDVDRRIVHRVLRNDARVTPRIERMLTNALDRLEIPPEEPDDLKQMKQTGQNVFRLANQVAQFIAACVERQVAEVEKEEQRERP